MTDVVSKSYPDLPVLLERMSRASGISSRRMAVYPPNAAFVSLKTWVAACLRDRQKVVYAFLKFMPAKILRKRPMIRRLPRVVACTEEMLTLYRPA